MPAEIAVVVGNHQGERLLPDCLESLAAQTLRPAEVVVVDGASTDRSLDVARGLGAETVAAANRGLGFLYNLGAAATGCEYVLLSNNDVAYEPECLELLAAALDADERRFAADPTQLSWDGGRVIHARTRLERGRLWREYLPGLRLCEAVSADSIVPTVFANGAAMLVRRRLLLELGGFDETFFLECEDLDLCWRAWLRGRPSVYVPLARVRHRVGAATDDSVRPRRSASAHHNLLRFALKCLPASTAARVVAGEALRLPRHPRAIAPAFVRVGTELREIRDERRALGPGGELLDWMLAGQPS